MNWQQTTLDSHWLLIDPAKGYTKCYINKHLHGYVAVMRGKEGEYALRFDDLKEAQDWALVMYRLRNQP